MRIFLCIIFALITSCSYSGLNKNEDAKYVGYLDTDVSVNNGKHFLIKDRSYKIVTNKKGKMFAQLIDTAVGGRAVEIDENGCVGNSTPYNAWVDTSIVSYIEITPIKWKFKPSNFCFKIRKFGE